MTVMTQAPATAQRYMQGIAVPATSVRPPEFFARTRRHTILEKGSFFTGGLGGSDIIELRKSDIIGEITVKFSGSLVITGAGVSTTARWPYDMLKQVRLTANGQSNLINASGLKLKAREVMTNNDLTDRGVSQLIGSVARTQGTLSLDSETWGAGSASTIAAGTYPVELVWVVPVADSMHDLAGAIFAATSTTDISLALDYETVGNLFTGYGGTAPALTGTFEVVSTKFSIPQGPDGEIVVPELNLFHQLVQGRKTDLQNGSNETRLSGQGVGKSLLRCYAQVWNGAGAAAVPLPLNATNFGRHAWRYSGNETPDEYPSAAALRYANERAYNSDVGAFWGFFSHEFAAQNAFRDVVDQGTTSDLRITYDIPNSLTLTSPAIEYVAETILAA
jgi:hypothetical protein